MQQSWHQMTVACINFFRTQNKKLMEVNMKISENIALITLGRKEGSDMNLVLAWDDKNLVLIDAGVPGQGEEIARAISKLGFRAENLTHLVITHQDLDHVGSVWDLKKLAPNMQVVAHAEESPYIDGREVPIKLAARLDEYDGLLNVDKAFVDAWKNMYEQHPIPVDHEVHDGEVFDICGGMEFVHVPGHTPGHIAVYFVDSRIIVCGDAANIRDGKVTGSNPVYTQDMDLANESLEKIVGYDLSGLVAYHGGYLEV